MALTLTRRLRTLLLSRTLRCCHSRPPFSMKFPLAPLLAANAGGVAAFQVPPRPAPGGGLSRASSSNNHGVAFVPRRGLASTARMAESLAEFDAATAASSSSSAIAAAPPAFGGEGAKGEVLSYQTTSSGSFAVVRVCEEDLILPTTLTAAGVGTTGGSVPMAGEEEGGPERVELADALFGGSSQQVAKKDGKGLIADGDLMGRTVTLPNSSEGMVVAHRHPIAFVLLDDSPGSSDTGSDGSCSISPKPVSLDPTSIPPGSTVDYLGRHVAVLHDGSVSRSLPTASSTKGEVDLVTGSGIGSADGIHLLVNAEDLTVDDNGAHGSNSDRPIFVPIPKISDIGLIDSPLVTGITAIDALTPIGKGQNMLVIGKEESLEEEKAQGGVNKRGWMINLLRNVVEGHRGDRDNMRCFYGLTSSDRPVRSSVMERIEKAGIRDDIVTVVSTQDAAGGAHGILDRITTERAMEAAEAVAVAAAACTLGEHHALTTGGDAVVIIDDINNHKTLWDITTQHLVQVYGADAVVEADLTGGSSSEMRGFFSGLIQRAARFKTKNGGGSVTLLLLSRLPNPEEESAESEGEHVFEASDFDGMSEKIQARISMLVKAKVPLTPANLRKISIPVPRPSASEDEKRLALQHAEDLISMSDGQIWLDDELARQGRSPPLDPSRSMTRVGVGADTLTCRADAPALRSVVGSLRFEFQQAMDSAEGMGDAKQVQRRDAFLLAMHQEPSEVRKLSQECTALLAASKGHLDKLATASGREAVEGLLKYVEAEAGDITRSIDETLDLSLDERKVLEKAIESYFQG